MTITELRALMAKATPGPWHMHFAPKYNHIKGNGGHYVFEPGCPPRQKTDAALIVAMHTMLPKLLAVVDSARRLASAVQDMNDAGYADAALDQALNALSALEDA